MIFLRALLTPFATHELRAERDVLLERSKAQDLVIRQQEARILELRTEIDRLIVALATANCRVAELQEQLYQMARAQRMPSGRWGDKRWAEPRG